MRLSCFPLVLASALAAAASAQARPLVVVNVAAPAINCVFNDLCRVTVADGLAAIAARGISAIGPWPGHGLAVLQTRAYAGDSGSAAAGETSYEYRLVMNDTVGRACVAALELNVGPIKRHYDDFSAKLADIYVVTRNAVGTIGVKSAEQDGGILTFDKPVCAGAGPNKGDHSFFFGFAAAGRPQIAHGTVQLVGGQALATDARVPRH